MTYYSYRSDDPDCPDYEQCPTCDHPSAKIEWEIGPDEIMHCNHCRVASEVSQ